MGITTNIKHLYRSPALSSSSVKAKLKSSPDLDRFVQYLNTEYCFNVEYSGGRLSDDDIIKLKWLLSDPSTKSSVSVETIFNDRRSVLEIGPRLNFSTAFSTNAVSICHAIGLNQVTRLEVSIRYQIRNYSDDLDEDVREKLADVICDRMTEYIYAQPIETFDHGLKPQPWHHIDVIGRGEIALREINKKLGLSFTEWDIQFYANLFVNILKRNPTDVECFDLAQSNSEHSRHWFFKGRILIDGVEQPESLLQMVMNTQDYSNKNNVIKFGDNSSAIRGFTARSLRPSIPYAPSQFDVIVTDTNLIFTAETHNFPTAVSPFSGAATGTGGRIRDIQAVGRGGNTIAGTVGYSVGNLFIPGYHLPWEDGKFRYSSKFAKPLKILIEASNGTSDYGNKFGEPVIAGFTRSFGLIRAGEERVEYIKPILFSGGLGTLDSEHIRKKQPKKGIRIVKFGGPVYRIGVGGGSASSTQIQGDSKSELDFGAVQRGDPEMEQKLNRVIRACIEMKPDNPILSIHDQGAGGNGNVLKELIEPNGGVIFTKSFQLGDSSLSTLELWCAEYQENNAILCNEESIPLLKSICFRECCPFSEVGFVTDNGRVILVEQDQEQYTIDGKINVDDIEQHDVPVNLDLNLVLGEIPRKTFDLERISYTYTPLILPDRTTVFEGLQLVLRLPSVCSKRFLINKVDRSVTGLVVQQQCVGPLHTPVADVAVTAISYVDKVGIATSIGEQPIKALINPAAGARMSVAEALTNLVFAPISSLRDVKCSANWMWPAKLPGEGAALFESCIAMCDIMKSLNIAVDGGKDSLSMATRLDNDEIVKSPGTLVISTYVACTDTTSIITPDLKSAAMNKNGSLIWVDISEGKRRLGGSALAQCLNQLGQSTPDIEKADMLKAAFTVIQNLIKEQKIMSGHDISDGGLITCALEMAFAGLCGLNLDLNVDDVVLSPDDVLGILFAEECGWILECSEENLDYVLKTFQNQNVHCSIIGSVGSYGINSDIVIKINGEEYLRCDLCTLLKMWEETSYRIEKEQMNPILADEEFIGLSIRTGPTYKYELPLYPEPIIDSDRRSNIKVAVIREEGINGDREMVAALHMAGFNVWDVTMRDVLERKVSINDFRGIVFPGGFSYADVFGSSKGWAASLVFNSQLREQFIRFYERNDTFSLGVCNGCQLMALLGWIGNLEDVAIGNSEESNVILSTNDSNRFESRFSTVRVCKTSSIMLNGMEESILGVWIAHGEGKFHFKNDGVFQNLQTSSCLALKYVDENGNETEKYPFNPNGSPAGVAGICSTNGRHLAMMPHPERCVQFWQWPYIPPEWKSAYRCERNMAPWFQMFLNAYNWCCS